MSVIPETRRLRDQAIELACVADTVLREASAFLAGARALHSRQPQEDVMRLLDLAAAHAEEWADYFKKESKRLDEKRAQARAGSVTA